MDTIARIINQYSKLLLSSTSPRVDVELLLSYALKKPREFLYSHPDYQLSESEEKAFNSLLVRRQSGEPIAYISNRKEFWSLELYVNPSVLIPRPETELIVETALKNLDTSPKLILELGTGSGAISLALAKERPNWSIIATDVSNDALEVAKYNAQKLQINNVEFLLSDWFQNIPCNKFDAIISNPPYVAADDPHLNQGDLRFEPQNALIAGDGLDAFRKIISAAPSFLKPGGLILVEHGFDQKEKLAELFGQANFKNVTCYQDLAGVDRVTAGNI